MCNTTKEDLKLNKQPTEITYSELDTAYAFFNKHLFQNRLPPCLITLQREKRTLGYFSRKRFINKENKHVDELAMNPSYFAIRTIEETLSTLVHEMTHVEQEYYGKPSRNGYHNKEWGDLMQRVGLCPSNTGQKGGKRTGQKMSHYIIKGGAFDMACKQLLDEQFTLSWYDRFPPVTNFQPVFSLGLGSDTLSLYVDDENDNEEDDENKVTVNPSFLSFPVKGENKSNRSKYRCPSCSNQIWGKPNLKIKCGEDDCNDILFDVV